MCSCVHTYWALRSNGILNLNAILHSDEVGVCSSGSLAALHPYSQTSHIKSHETLVIGICFRSCLVLECEPQAFRCESTRIAVYRQTTPSMACAAMVQTVHEHWLVDRERKGVALNASNAFMKTEWKTITKMLKAPMYCREFLFMRTACRKQNHRQSQFFYIDWRTHTNSLTKYKLTCKATETQNKHTRTWQTVNFVITLAIFALLFSQLLSLSRSIHWNFSKMFTQFQNGLHTYQNRIDVKRSPYTTYASHAECKWKRV